MTFNLTFKDGEMAVGESYGFQCLLRIHKRTWSVWQKLQLRDKSLKEQPRKIQKGKVKKAPTLKLKNIKRRSV